MTPSPFKDVKTLDDGSLCGCGRRATFQVTVEVLNAADLRICDTCACELMNVLSPLVADNDFRFREAPPALVGSPCKCCASPSVFLAGHFHLGRIHLLCETCIGWYVMQALKHLGASLRAMEEFRKLSEAVDEPPASPLVM